MPHCYDLVGTIAEVRYPGETLYNILYEPKGAFTIITAQKSGGHADLYAQVREAFPNVQRIHTVRMGTDTLEGQRKAAVLKRISAHSYTDNNSNILDAIHLALPDLPLYLATNGRRRRYV
jgi:hypothetical protein